MWAGKYIRALRKGRWEYASRTNDVPAVVVLAEVDGQVILIEQDRAAVGARCIELPAGATVFRHEEGGDQVYLVRSGLVHVRLPLAGDKYHHLATFGPGELFGELSFLDQRARSADAIAATDASLYMLSRERFVELAGSDPALAARCFEGLARLVGFRLRQADAELLELEER